MKESDWMKMLPACFGVEDLIFGGHESDLIRAKAMFKAALDKNASMDEIAAAVEAYLLERKARAEHIEEQVKKVRNLGQIASAD
jgi:hypothetical protein